MQANDRSSATETAIPTRPGELDRAMAKIKQVLLDGLRHGFFEFSVSGEAIKRDKRRIIIKAGNTHVFVVSSEELKTRRE